MFFGLIRDWLRWPGSSVVGRVDKLVVDSVVQLAVVVDLVLSVLIATPGRKLNQSFLFNHRCLSLVDGFKLSVIRHRRIERGQDNALS